MYDGPEPKKINENFNNHTYDRIVCLINGEYKKSMTNRYLQKFGYTRETYQEKFKNAPLISHASRDAYRKSSLSDEGRKIRSDNLTKLNSDKKFQSKRKKGVTTFWKSESSNVRRKNQSIRAKEQHKNGQAKYIQNYFNTKFKGSSDQIARSKRMTENNPGSDPDIRKKMIATYLKNSKNGVHYKETRIKKKKFKSTDLIFQSTYEYDFLELCEKHGWLSRVSNAPCLTHNLYPYNFYEPDYLIDNKLCIEIKSWYIEKLQESKYPGIKQLKTWLVEKYKFQMVYILDKDYSEFISIMQS